MTSDASQFEFSRPLTIDRIGVEGYDITVQADPAECAALAARMHLPAVQSLTCRFRLRPARGIGKGDSFEGQGSLRAKVTQTCVVTLDDFPTELSEEFIVHFVPAGTEDEEPELDSVDEIPYTGTVIDLGEASAEQLALALEPYPRKPGVELEQDSAISAENPFARLAALRKGH